MVVLQPARMKKMMDQSKIEELECSQDFPHYNPIRAICCHGNQNSDWIPPNPLPNDAPDEI